MRNTRNKINSMKERQRAVGSSLLEFRSKRENLVKIANIYVYSNSQQPYHDTEDSRSAGE